MKTPAGDGVARRLRHHRRARRVSSAVTPRCLGSARCTREKSSRSVGTGDRHRAVRSSVTTMCWRIQEGAALAGPVLRIRQITTSQPLRRHPGKIFVDHGAAGGHCLHSPARLHKNRRFDQTSSMFITGPDAGQDRQSARTPRKNWRRLQPTWPSRVRYTTPHRANRTLFDVRAAARATCRLNTHRRAPILPQPRQGPSR